MLKKVPSQRVHAMSSTYELTDKDLNAETGSSIPTYVFLEDERVLKGRTQQASRSATRT